MNDYEIKTLTDQRIAEWHAEAAEARLAASLRPERVSLQQRLRQWWSDRRVTATRLRDRHAH